MKSGSLNLLEPSGPVCNGIALPLPFTNRMGGISYTICISSNSEGSEKLPDDGRLLLKHVETSVVQISAFSWSFLLRLIMYGTNIKLLLSR
jgi:hypothetical protein